jgi:hypothetical protein
MRPGWGVQINDRQFLPLICEESEIGLYILSVGQKAANGLCGPVKLVSPESANNQKHRDLSNSYMKKYQWIVKSEQ